MNKIPLKELCTLIMGQSPSSDSYNKEKRGLPFYQGNADFGTLHPVTRIWCDAPKKLAYEGNILISVRAPIGAINIAEETCSIGRGLAAIVPNLEKCDLTYFFYAMRASCRYLQNKGTGSTFKAINKEALENLPLPNYDKKKQYMIGKKLQQIDVLSDKYKGQIDLLNVLVQSRFIEMFGTWKNTKYDVKTIEELCEPIKDGTHQTPTYTDDKENGFLFLSSKDVTSRYIDWNHPKYIPKDLHEELSKRIRPKKGDILLAKNGTTGIAAIVDKDFVFDIYVSLALLRFHPGNNIKFMWMAINMPETKIQFNSHLKGIGVPNLHLGEIKKTKLIVPPIELQEKFAKLEEQVDKSKYRGEESRHFLGICYKMVMNMI